MPFRCLLFTYVNFDWIDQWQRVQDSIMHERLNFERQKARILPLSLYEINCQAQNPSPSPK